MLQLMMKNEVVMEIDFDQAEYNVINKDLLPFVMQNKIKRVPDFSEIHSKFDDTQRQIIIRHNYDAILSFLASRILPITRENAKKIYNLLGFSQLQDDYSKAKVALVCRALSLQDNYWLKIDKDKSKWEDVCLRNVSLSEAVAQVSLHGTNLTFTNKKEEAMKTPELTGQGAYAKAWVREEDGLYLYKKGANGATEAKIEVMVSTLLDNCNVNHLKYIAGESNGEYICKCKCMTNDDISILSGMDFDVWCTIQGMDSRKEALKIDSEAIYKMWIVDYLICNSDRHGLNWGFFYNCNTNKILGCHPLYDHNNAFDIPLMYDENAEYLYDNSMTMKQAAEIAMKKVDFHFYRAPQRQDFLTERQYNVFTKRAKELNIQIIPKQDMTKEIDNEYEPIDLA